MIGIIGYTLSAIGLLCLAIGLFALITKLLSDEFENVLGTVLTIGVGTVVVVAGILVLIFGSPAV